jgi:hypothetical protein
MAVKNAMRTPRGIAVYAAHARRAKHNQNLAFEPIKPYYSAHVMSRIKSGIRLIL